MYQIINFFTRYVGLFIFSVSMHATTYKLTYSNDMYTNLVSPTVLSSPGWGFENYENIPIGFNFKYFGRTHSSISISAPGRISFTNFSDGDVIIPGQGFFKYYQNLAGVVSYKIEGNSPSRIFKVEWRNAGLMLDTDSNAYCNLQVWLYEAGNKIEFRHGMSQNIGTNLFFDGGPFYGLLNHTADSMYCIKGNPANPALVLNPGPPEVLTAMPANGQTYTFTPDIVTPPAPVITFIIPSGGETWKWNESKIIQWTYNGNDNVKVELSINNGASWSVIASSLPKTQKTYTWIIPQVESATCKIKISEVTNANVKSVSNAFSIIKAGNDINVGEINEFKVWPNPSTGKLHIESGLQFQFRVIDLQGRVLDGGQSTQTLLNLELSPGIYYLELISGTLISRRKIIVN